MPQAIPLIGAAFSISSGVAAAGGMAAIAAGGLSAITLTSGLMIAGGALSAVGTLTGNKKLSAIGAVMGLAGGIGNALGKTASVADAAGAAKEAAGASSTANVGGQVVQGAAADALPSAAEAATKTASEASKAIGDGGVLRSAMEAPAGPDFGALNSDTGGLVEGARGAAAAAPDVVQAGAKATPNFGTLATESRGFYPDLMAQQAPQGGSWWDSVKDLGKDFAKFTKDNPELTRLAGGAIGGVGEYLGGQQLVKDRMKAEMKYSDWVRQRYSDSVRNLTVPTIRAPAPSGIIGGARG